MRSGISHFLPPGILNIFPYLVQLSLGVEQYCQHIILRDDIGVFFPAFQVSVHFHHPARYYNHKGRNSEKSSVKTENIEQRTKRQYTPAISCKIPTKNEANWVIIFSKKVQGKKKQDKMWTKILAEKVN